MASRWVDMDSDAGISSPLRCVERFRPSRAEVKRACEVAQLLDVNDTLRIWQAVLKHGLQRLIKA